MATTNEERLGWALVSCIHSLPVRRRRPGADPSGERKEDTMTTTRRKKKRLLEQASAVTGAVEDATYAAHRMVCLAQVLTSGATPTVVERYLLRRWAYLVNCAESSSRERQEGPTNSVLGNLPTKTSRKRFCTKSSSQFHVPLPGSLAGAL